MHKESIYISLVEENVAVHRARFKAIVVSELPVYLVLAPILYSSAEDVVYRSLLNVGNTSVTWFIHLFMSTFIGFCLVSGELKIAIIASISLCIVFYLKNRDHLARFTLEAHYEALFHLLLVAVIIDSRSLIYGVSTCLLLSSLSAGISKSSSSIWIRSKQAMSMYILMPWLSRRTIVKVLKTGLVRYAHMKKILSISSILVPILQISTPIIIFLSLFIFDSLKCTYVSTLAWAFQIIFPILLYLISGLGLIPYFYLISVSILLVSSNESLIPVYSLKDLDLILSVILIGLYAYSSIGFVSKDFAYRLGPFFRKGPFHMFTERNLVGMIVPGLKLQKCSSVQFPFPFNHNGERSISQSFTSAKFFSIYYSLMDAYLSSWPSHTLKVEKIESISFGNAFQSKIMQNICRYYSDGTIDFYQYVWNSTNFEYTKQMIGSVVFNKRYITYEVKTPLASVRQQT